MAVLSTWGVLAPPSSSRAEAQLAALREQGIYPPPGSGSDEDVRRVLRASNRIFAIKLYREIHDVPLKDAVAAVKRME